MYLIVYCYNPCLLSVEKHQATVVSVILKLTVGSYKKKRKELNDQIMNIRMQYKMLYPISLNASPHSPLCLAEVLWSYYI